MRGTRKRELKVESGPTVATALAVALLDVVTKLLGRALLPADGVFLLPVLALRVVDNVRGPFGLGPLWLTIVASMVVLLLLGRRQLSPAFPLSRFPTAAAGLLLGGGVSNLAERLFFGRTTDLLDIGRLTAINLADVAILVGLALLLWRQKRK